MNPSNSTRARAWARRLGAAVATATIATIALSGCTANSGPTVEVPALTSGALSDDVVAQLQTATETTVAQFSASGAVVGVWVPWAGSWVSGVGTVSKEEGAAAVSTDMSFRVGEITREMTCDALYGMVADGTVKLGDSVADYVLGVSSVKDGIQDVTLQMLCDSTSGIGAVPASVTNQFISMPDRQWRPRELASFGLSSPSTGAAGEAYAESDTNYLLLGLALEKASGLSAHDYLAKYVTEPLGLTDTELPSDAPADPQPAPAFTGLQLSMVDGSTDCTAGVDVTTRSASSGYTNAGVTSTIGDLGVYARALAAGSLNAEGADSRFASPVPASAGAPGWSNVAGGSNVVGPLIGQAGTQNGYAAAAYSDPNTGLTIAVVLNNSWTRASANNLALQLAAIASKAAAVEGETAPDSGLSWTAEQFAEANAGIALCAAG